MRHANIVNLPLEKKTVPVTCTNLKYNSLTLIDIAANYKYKGGTKLAIMPTFGFFTISKSDRRSVRQKTIRKNKFTKKLHPVGFDLPTATITAFNQLGHPDMC